jgi:hypothetical protein
MIGELPLDLPVVLLLGSVRGGGGIDRGRDRLRLRTGENHDDDGDHEDGEDPGPGSGTSALGSLLRHEPLVPDGGAGDHPRWLNWISYNRVWVVPYTSAVFVVLVEVLVGVFGSRPLPGPAHAALTLFWLWAIGRGTTRRESQRRREEEIRALARTLGIPASSLADEFAEFKARRLRRREDA